MPRTINLKIALTTLVMLAACATSHAQYSDSVHYYTGLASTGSFNSTTTSKAYLFSNILKLGVRKKDIALNATNSWIYGEEQKRLTNNDYTTTLDFNLYKTLPHFYYWGLANYTTSYSLKINEQYQAGAGIAYSVLDKKRAYLNISNGILYENSDITLPDSTRNAYHTFRNSFRLTFRFTIWDVINVSSTSFYQNSFSSGSDYIIRSNISAGVIIKKWFTLSTAFSYNRFNRTQKENTLISYGLTVDKYF